MRNILKAFAKTGSASMITLILGIISTKIMALILGPSGIGLYSIIRQIIMTASTLGTGSQTALIQGLASKDGIEKQNYLKTIFLVFLSGGIILFFLILIFSPMITKLILASTDNNLITLVRWISIPVFLIIIQLFLNGILNSFRAIGYLAIAQVIAALITAILAYPTAILVKTDFIIAFIWMISISTLCSIIFMLIIIYRKKWLNFKLLTSASFNKASLRHFYNIAGVTLITGFLATGSILFIKSLIVQQNGLEGAGLFDVAWTLSMMYVMLISTSFGTYYLPTLINISETKARVEFIQNIFKIVILILTPIVISIIVFKPLIIEILYSEKFIQSLDIIKWMLIGDYFKVTSWILAMPLLAYANMKIFFWTEFLWFIGFLVLSTIFIFIGKLEYVGFAFMLMYILYCLYFFYYTPKKYSLPLQSIIIPWSIGLILVLLVSWQTWNDTKINWLVAITWILIAMTFSWVVATQNGIRKLRKV